MRRGAFVWRACLAALGATALGCANGGSDTGPDGDGSVGTLDGSLDATGDGRASADARGDGTTGDGSSGDDGGSEGGATTFAKACKDNASDYCTQLAKCSPYLLDTQYGSTSTCESRLAYCSDVVSAKGSGWTADGLETCVKARSKLSCEEFLNERPSPPSCIPTGTLKVDATCRYGTQCASGYCKYTGSSMCGTCTTLGGSGAVCASSSDCEGQFMCSTSGACTKPSAAGGACSATTPCALGLDCIGAVCVKPEAVGAACDGGVPCDPAVGAYCSGTSCAEMSVSKASGTCGGTTHAGCSAGGDCLAGTCVAPIQDGKACDGGVPCFTPSTCNAGKCGLYAASNCK